MATTPNELIETYTPICSDPEMEGTVPWMYLDSRGNVTAAIGIMLPNLAAAQALPWWAPSFTRAATELEISLEFARVSKMAPGLKSDAYRNNVLSPLLRGSDIDAMLAKELGGFIAELAVAFPGFWSWPQGAQLGALDMIYNLGAAGLLGSEIKEGFPKWVAAAKEEDWPVCAEQCEREGIGQIRNTWTQGQFNAASMAAVTT